MIDSTDIEIFLPKYLSPENQDKLLSDLKKFPSNIDQRMYGFYGIEQDVIYQGDGIDDLLIINLPCMQTQKGNGMVVSNTCDIDLANRRNFSSKMVYAPILKLNKYIDALKKENIYSVINDLNNHIKDIREQKIAQIFYLPQYGDFEESFVLLDRLISVTNNTYDRKTLESHRIFSLSQYGHYLFLYKLSIHFTRFHEKVDRGY
jgi:hypothetical protein